MNKIQLIKSNIRNAKRYVLDTSFLTKYLYMRRMILNRFKETIPQRVLLGVTYRCQCSCVHCFLGPELNKKNNELSREEIFQLIEDSRNEGVLEVGFFGGEPMLREDIVDLVRFASSRGLLTTLFTNGILLTQKKTRELRDAGLHYCNISIDSADYRRHNTLRGYDGGFQKAVKGIKHAVESGIKCNIWTYASKNDINEHDLKDAKSVICMAKELKVKSVVMLFPIASGNWFCSSTEILTLDERNKVRSLYDPPFVVLEFPTEETKCDAGKGFLYVSPHGKIFPCPAVPNNFGDVHYDSIQDISRKMTSDFVKCNSANCGECVMNQSSTR